MEHKDIKQDKITATIFEYFKRNYVKVLIGQKLLKLPFILAIDATSNAIGALHMQINQGRGIFRGIS